MRRSELAVAIDCQQPGAVVARTKRIESVAHVLRAAVPEIAEVENCIDHAGSIAATGAAGLNALACVGRIRIGEHRIVNQGVLLHAGEVARRGTDYSSLTHATTVDSGVHRGGAAGEGSGVVGQGVPRTRSEIESRSIGHIANTGLNCNASVIAAALNDLAVAADHARDHLAHGQRERTLRTGNIVHIRNDCETIINIGNFVEREVTIVIAAEAGSGASRVVVMIGALNSAYGRA